MKKDEDMEQAIRDHIALSKRMKSDSQLMLEVMTKLIKTIQQKPLTR